MRRLKLRLAVIVVAPALIYGAYIARLSYPGYCFAQEKYLSDDEYIGGALPRITWQVKVENAKSTPEDYVRTHPSCCSVYHHASSWFENFLDSHYVEVELNYEVKPEMAKILGTPFYKSYVHVSACGVAGRTYGEGTRTLQTATQYGQIR